MRVGKRLLPGKYVETRLGRVRVIRAEANGRILHVQTRHHGRQRIERAENGHWCIYDTEDGDS